jgi:hypothetical protein
MKEIIKGEWYLSTACWECGEVIYLGHDSTRGNIFFVGESEDALIEVTCPHCHQNSVHHASEFVSREAPESLAGVYTILELF